MILATLFKYQDARANNEEDDNNDNNNNNETFFDVLDVATKLLSTTGVKPDHFVIVTDGLRDARSYSNLYRRNLDRYVSVRTSYNQCKHNSTLLRNRRRDKQQVLAILFMLNQVSNEEGLIGCLQALAKRTKFHREVLLLWPEYGGTFGDVEAVLEGTYVDSGVFLVKESWGVFDMTYELSEAYRSGPSTKVVQNHLADWKFPGEISR